MIATATPPRAAAPHASEATTPQQAFRDILDEAIQIFPDPNRRLALTLRVRQSRPATLRDLLLQSMVRYLHWRCEHARRIEESTGAEHTWESVFPEIPMTAEEICRLASTVRKGG